MLMARYDCFTSLGYYALSFMDTVFFPLCVLEHKGAIGRTSISGFVVFFLETLRPRPGFRQHTRCLQHTERTAQNQGQQQEEFNSMGGLLEDIASHRRFGAEAISPPLVLISSKNEKIGLHVEYVQRRVKKLADQFFVLLFVLGGLRVLSHFPLFELHGICLDFSTRPPRTSCVLTLHSTANLSHPRTCYDRFLLPKAYLGRQLFQGIFC